MSLLAGGFVEVYVKVQFDEKKMRTTNHINSIHILEDTMFQN